MKQMTALILLGVLLASCGGATATPVIPTQTEVPPTPTSTPTNTPVPSGPCDNPLIPLAVGNHWLYQSTSPQGTSQQELWVSGWDTSLGLNAQVEMKNLATGVESHDLVTCKEGGAIEDFPLFFTSMMLEDYIDGVFDTSFDSGLYSPAYQTFVDANWILNWEAGYYSEEKFCLTNPAFPAALCLSTSTMIDMTFETKAEYESVTVPAGTFPQALKVTCTLRMPATIKISDQLSTSAPLTVRTTQWYAPFVGLVRSQVDSAGLEFIAGQEQAVPLESVVELVEFTPGQ